MHQISNLLGVLDDGTNLAPDVPRNTATTVQITQFGTATIYVDVVYNSGAPVDIEKMIGWVAKLSVNRNIDPCIRFPDIHKLGTLVPGIAYKRRLQFTLVPADTRNLALGRYFFDVWLGVPGAQQWQIIRVSTLILTPGLAWG
jgi:hypothetical protein